MRRHVFKHRDHHGGDLALGHYLLGTVDEENISAAALFRSTRRHTCREKVFVEPVGLADAPLDHIALHRALEELLWDGDHYPIVRQ